MKIWSLWRPTRKGTHTNTVTLPDLRKNLLNLIVLIEEGVVSQSHLLPISAGDLLHVYLVSVLALLALWNCFLAYIRLVFPWVHRSYSSWRNLIIHAVTLSVYLSLSLLLRLSLSLSLSLSFSYFSLSLSLSLSLPHVFQQRPFLECCHLKLRGRRKSSQKLAKRRAFVWGEGVSTVFAKQASNKKKNWAARRLSLRALRSTGPCCCKSTSARPSGAGPTLRKGAANKSIECLVKEGNAWYKEKQVVEEFSEVWMILVTVRNRRRIENLLSLSCTPAVPRPRDSRTSRAEGTTAAVVLSDQATSGMSFGVSAAISSAEWSEILRDSFNEAAIYSSMSDLGLDAERLLTDDVRSARCSWQRWNKFQLCSWTWNIPTRSMTPSLLKDSLTSDRGINYRASDERHWEGLEGHTLSSGEDFQQWNVEACFAIPVRFKGGGRGWEWN